MKKILVILTMFLLTGCKNQLICTKEESNEDYVNKQKLTFTFDKEEKVSDAVINYTMVFEDEEVAQTYLTVFESLDEDYEIRLKNKELTIVSNNDYSQYYESKDELKKELEENGYSCK